MASVTGGYLALALALQPLIDSGEISGDSLKPPIGAVSVGIVQGVPLLDLNYTEDSRADVDLNVVMTTDGQFIEIQGTAESEPFSEDMLGQLLALAKRGIQEIVDRQQGLLSQS